METVEINGELYQKNESKTPSRSMSKLLMMTAAIGAMMPDFGDGGKKAPMPNVDIPTEYELILNKKSRLSSRQREWVKYMFEKRYTKVTNELQEALKKAKSKSRFEIMPKGFRIDLDGKWFEFDGINVFPKEVI